MSTVTPHRRAPASPTPTAPGTTADVLVAFGITGDLAKQMTLRSLYRLERRGLLNCPIVGVAVQDWSADDLRERAREAIVDGGETLEADVFDRFAARLSYLAGDFGDAATFERLAAALAGKRSPVFYLEIPPFLFGTVVKGLSEAGPAGERAASWSRSRSATTSSRRASSRPRCTPISTSRSCSGSTTSWGRWGSARSSTCGSPTRCSSRSGTATTSSRCRSRWPRTSASRIAGTSTTRSARCATSSSTT